VSQGSLHVLCAPACRRWAAEPVSEDGWLPMVFEHLLQIEPDSSVTAIVEVADIPSRERLRLVAVGQRRHELLGSATLAAKTALAVVRSRLLEGVDLVHIGLPFAVGWTQSAVPATARRRDLPIVVGPVQVPQTWMAADEIRPREELITGTPGWGRLRPGLVEQATAAAYKLASPLLAAGNRRLLRRADVVVAVDEAASSLVRAEGVAGERIRVVPPPLSCAPALARRPESGAPRLLTAGVLIERKAVDRVIRALALLRASGTAACLVIAGQGPQEPALRRLASALGVQDAVEFAGWLGKDRLRSLMATSSAYVTMSRSEAFPVSVIDAMASGLPVVSAANAGARSIVQQGVTGWLVPVDDDRALAARLRQMLADPRATSAVAERASRWARATMTPPVVAAGWLDAYRLALDLHGRASTAARHTAGTGHHPNGPRGTRATTRER
jgi:glycosyltransferase involved in cell wall biosynthesis